MSNQAKWEVGTRLDVQDKEHVLASYVHRFTGQHKPDWANKPWKDGLPYPVQHATDADWLANTKFAVKNNGKLDLRVKRCQSTPTWPNNPEFKIGGAR